MGQVPAHKLTVIVEIDAETGLPLGWAFLRVLSGADRHELLFQHRDTELAVDEALTVICTQLEEEWARLPVQLPFP